MNRVYVPADLFARAKTIRYEVAWSVSDSLLIIELMRGGHGLIYGADLYDRRPDGHLEFRVEGWSTGDDTWLVGEPLSTAAARTHDGAREYIARVVRNGWCHEPWFVLVTSVTILVAGTDSPDL